MPSTSILNPNAQLSSKRFISNITKDPAAEFRARFEEAQSAIAENRVPSYHQDNKSQYVLPNDLPEHVRLETQAFHISNMMNHQVLHAPVRVDAMRCLDIGCGTGIVTDLMSEKFPQSVCIGLDLSRVPELRPHRPNVRFFQGNVIAQRPSEWQANDHESGLVQDAGLFDYVFSRLLVGGMCDWPNFIRTEFEFLRLGGWAEVHELSLTWMDAHDNNLSDAWEWLKWFRRDLEGQKGMDLNCGEKVAEWMRDAGFVEVQVEKYWFPLCGWSESTPEMRAYGQYNATSVPSMLHHAIPRTVPDEEKGRIDDLRKEMKAGLVPRDGLHQYFYVTVGRKPE